jgi:hypothetical protein
MATRYQIMVGDVSFEEGKPQNFTAVKEFALNFDDRKIKSVKIKVGENVLYNGDVASYTKTTGEVVTGKVSSLKSVINRAKWLVPAATGKKGHGRGPVPAPAPVEPAPDYDPKRGGNFSSFMETEKNVKVAESKPPTTIIREEDRIVKLTPKKENPQQQKVRHVEVTNDQVDVRQVGQVGGERYTVNSSTSGKSGPKETRQAPIVIQAEDMGAARTIPISYKKEASSTDSKKRNSFMVDQNTSSLPQEPSLDDIRRVKGSSKIVQESQEATVVSRTSKPRLLDVQETEGITLKKVASPKDMTIKTTVGSGSTPIGDASDGVVVGKTTPMGEPEGTVRTASKSAEAKAQREKRLKQSAQTQAQIEAEKKTKPAPDPVSVQPAQDNNTDYMAMLPPTWSEMHWVQKEKFVKSLVDKDFIKFILSVESIKAVLNACEERLKELA